MEHCVELCCVILCYFVHTSRGARRVQKCGRTAQPVGSGASLREMIRNIDNYFAIG